VVLRAWTAVPYAQISVQFPPTSEVSNRMGDDRIGALRLQEEVRHLIILAW